MLKFTSIVGYTSCGPTYIESFLTIFGQCINVLNYKYIYGHKSLDIRRPTRHTFSEEVKFRILKEGENDRCLQFHIFGKKI